MQAKKMLCTNTPENGADRIRYFIQPLLKTIRIMNELICENISKHSLEQHHSSNTSVLAISGQARPVKFSLLVLTP